MAGAVGKGNLFLRRIDSYIEIRRVGRVVLRPNRLLSFKEMVINLLYEFYAWPEEFSRVKIALKMFFFLY